MSFNWNDDEREKKQYEFKGTVTISTEQYEDLIAEVYELRAKGQREHDDWYKEYRRAEDLDKKVKELEKKLAEINAWMDCDDRPNENLRFLFRQWKFSKQEDNSDE